MMRAQNPLRASRRQARQQGFSLLEALVAMVIAAMALGTLYRTVGQSSKNVVDVGARVEAALVARSALAAVAYAEDLEQQPTGQAGDWYWSLQVSPEQVQLIESDGRPSRALRAANVTVHVMHTKDGPAVLTWTTWKPYRAAP